MGIALLNTHVILDGKTILQGLDLELPENGVVGLSGPSGCGKTTLLLTLCGLIKPDKGRLISKPDQRTAMVFQEDRLLPWLTAGDNLGLILRDRQKVRFWLDRMQLGDEESLYPHQLSGGMKRRIALARALAYHGDLLLLDEPFQGMDLSLKKTVYPWIRQAAEKIPVMLVTHDSGELDSLADCVWQTDGPPLQLFPFS